jgi:hypothetical protein
MYEVRIEVYGKPIKTSSVLFPMDQWEKAIKYAEGASKLAELLGWTRHNVSGPIKHYTHYSDLYNEGAIQLNPPKDKDGTIIW